MVGQQRITIIGAGVIGLATAYALLKQGRRPVTLLEQATVDHTGGTSHGFSRLLRFEYGSDAFYSRMVQLSLERWKQLEVVSGCALYTPTGVLVVGSQEDGFTCASYRVAQELGLPVAYLTEKECNRCFP